MNGFVATKKSKQSVNKIAVIQFISLPIQKVSIVDTKVTSSDLAQICTKVTSSDLAQICTKVTSSDLAQICTKVTSSDFAKI